MTSDKILAEHISFKLTACIPVARATLEKLGISHARFLSVLSSLIAAEMRTPETLTIGALARAFHIFDHDEYYQTHDDEAFYAVSLALHQWSTGYWATSFTPDESAEVCVPQMHEFYSAKNALVAEGVSRSRADACIAEVKAAKPRRAAS